MARSKLALYFIIIFFVGRHFVVSSGMTGFLAHNTIQNNEITEEAHTGATHATEEEGEGGLEFHFAFGTAGFYGCVFISVLCTIWAGAMSGLTVGLLSIDTLELEMKLIHGTEEQRQLATKVLPLLKKHHYLLVTLLLCNAVAMEALPIFLDAIVPAAWAIAISVTAVLFVGEIIPQALCTGPKQLRIAYCVAPYVSFLMIAVGIIAYPISVFLDHLLGEHHAIRYTNNDLKALIELHSFKALQETLENPHSVGFGLQNYQTRMIQGAIDSQSVKIKDIMIPFERLYSVRIDKKLDLAAAKKLSKAGYSRIPVYILKDRHAIVGYLLIKSLVGVDLSKGDTIAELVHDAVVTLRKPIYVSPNEEVGGLLMRFKIGKSHMAIVTDNIKQMEFNMQRYIDDDGSFMEENGGLNESQVQKQPKVLGIITLEDIIESTLKEQIFDEADYDLENEANVKFKYDRDDHSDIGGMPQPKRSSINTIHRVLQDKIQRNLVGRKPSEKNLLLSNAAGLQPIEMSEMSESLLKESGDQTPNINANKGRVLMRQLKDTEMSKSYSFFGGGYKKANNL